MNLVIRRVSSRILVVSQNPELTVLMPCLNEAETLATCITKAQNFMRTKGVSGEVLIADNGSTDGSQEIAEELGARVIQVEKRGYGNALIAGIDAARGTFVIMGDADDSYDFTRLEEFLGQLRAGNDLVMGNRFQGGISAGAMPWLHKYLGNPVLSWLGRKFYKVEIRDFHCGLRGMRREAIQSLDLRCGGMEFASEMVVKSQMHNLRICEVPTTLSPDGRSRAPHLRTWRDGWRHLRFLFLYSPRWLFLYPGLLLVLISLVLGIVIEAMPLEVGGVGFGVDSLVVLAALMIMGVEAVSLAVFSKIYGMNVGLIPRDDRLDKYSIVLKLETLLLIGLILMFLGISGLVISLSYWHSRNFGGLDPTQSLKIVVPAATVLVVGFQIFMAGLFVGVLDIV
jgi:glycosyltransferase involved in cell wall biosynthesis